MMLPEPSLSFNIPSLGDDTLLSCRIYLPDQHIKAPLQLKKGAIVAHPYAPLGGCFDDPVVELVSSVFVKYGYIVMTFNFRQVILSASHKLIWTSGAGDSGGRTSWTGKAEIEDYSSVVAFFIEYLRQLKLQDAHEPSKEEKLSLVLGGYSYGSQIVTRLPDLSTILKSLVESPSHATTEISTRAKTLATQTSEDLASAVRSQHLTVPGESPARSSFDHCLAIGGDETPGSSDGAHSHSKVRSSMDDVSRRISKHFKRHSRDGDIGKDDKAHEKEPSTRVQSEQPPTNLTSNIETYYLLISPLLPPISTLIALPFFSSSTPEEQIQKFKEHPSLAVFGGKDLFTSAKKLRAWCSEIGNVNTRFRWVEIDEASHFWHEPGVERRMSSAVTEWIAEIER